MTIYPTTITDGTGRVWRWSEFWSGYRTEGQMTHGYDTIKTQWGIRDEKTHVPFLSYGMHPNLNRITKEES